MTNWAEYDAGLRARGSLTVWFTPEAIEAWRAEPRIGRGGQPSYSDLAIATALTLRAVFRLALRQTEGLIGSVLQLLGLNLPVPDHSTLSRRAETLEVARPKAGNAPPVNGADNLGRRAGAKWGHGAGRAGRVGAAATGLRAARRRPVSRRSVGAFCSAPGGSWKARQRSSFAPPRPDYPAAS